MSNDYKETLNLPKTDFPMKADLPILEPKILKKWEEERVYEKMLKLRENGESFVLHDGPPYANGHIHMGHALNKVLKDIIIKFKTLKGFRCVFIPGWDCHGLPIELKVEEEKGKKEDKIAFIKECREFAEHYISVQREEFKRLGVFGDWENPYKTMDPYYEGRILEEFGKIVERGYVYRGLKPVLWCIHCKTALAEAEVEYQEKTSPSIYVKFELTEDSREKIGFKDERVYVIIWTTTPWTLPANLAIAFHPEYEYSAFKTEDGIYILASKLLQRFEKETGISGTPVKSFHGREFEFLKAYHPFYRRESLFVLANYVTLEEGTGCVHTAPGHGKEDYETGIQYKLEPYSPVDENGIFDSSVEVFKGMNVFDANPVIIEHMRKKGSLLKEGKIIHSYPHCWRCKNPVIFRTTPQWFISVDKNSLRKRALEEISNVRWVPPWGRERISGMMEARSDWCISRQRIWGIPIPSLKCKKCDEEYLEMELIKKCVHILKNEGIEGWHRRGVEELLGEKRLCKKCGEELVKGENILDVWFDSGVSHSVVLENNPALRWPADMYLEGSDQHRGWFHSSLLTAVATRERAPYRIVLTHGFVVDGEGRKMAKSLGNVISPDEIIGKHGAEIVRLWASAEDYTEDMKLSQEILSGLVDAYRKIRNTIRFLLGNLYDFNPSVHSLPLSELTHIDKFILYKFNHLINEVSKAYEDFAFHRVYHSVYRFCTVELSSFYFDILKDRLYTFASNSKERRSSQTAFYLILKNLLIILSPILSFTCEEAWGYLPGEKSESVFLENFPSPIPLPVDEDFIKEHERLLEIRDEVLKALEVARKSKFIRSSLEAEIVIRTQGEDRTLLEKYRNFLPTLFIVSKVRLEDGKKLEVMVEKAKGKKCARCWNYSELVGTFDPPDVCERCIKVLKP
jgi:isoleucyl-tRNA synthetase